MHTSAGAGPCSRTKACLRHAAAHAAQRPDHVSFGRTSVSDHSRCTAACQSMRSSALHLEKLLDLSSNCGQIAKSRHHHLHMNIGSDMHCRTGTVWCSAANGSLAHVDRRRSCDGNDLTWGQGQLQRDL